MSCSWVASARRQAYRLGAQIYEAHQHPTHVRRLRQAWTDFRAQFGADEEIIIGYLELAYKRGGWDAEQRNEGRDLHGWPS